MICRRPKEKEESKKEGGGGHSVRVGGCRVSWQPGEQRT